MGNAQRCSPAAPAPRPAPAMEVLAGRPFSAPRPARRGAMAAAAAELGRTGTPRPAPTPPPPAHGPPPRATRPCPTARAQLRLAAHLPWLPETRVGAAAGLLRGGPAMAARSGRARAGLPWSRRGGPGRPASAAPRVQGRAGDPRRSPSRLHLRLARARPSRGRGRREQREAHRRLLGAAVLRTSSAPPVPARGPAQGGEGQRAGEGRRGSLLCASRGGARPPRVPGPARHGAGAAAAPCFAPHELEREGEGGRREGEGGRRGRRRHGRAMTRHGRRPERRPELGPCCRGRGNAAPRADSAGGGVPPRHGPPRRGRTRRTGAARRGRRRRTGAARRGRRGEAAAARS